MYYPLDTVAARPECRPALDTLERHGIALPAEGWLVIGEAGVSLGAGDPGGAGVTVTSGPYALGSGAGLTASEAAAYVRGRIGTSAAAGVIRWTVALEDGAWLVAGLGTGDSLVGAWTVAAGSAPGSVARVSA
jgi:hypothetical protein